MRGRQVRAALVLVLANFRLLFYLAWGVFFVVLGAVPGAAELFSAEPSQAIQSLGFLPYTTAHSRDVADVVGRIFFLVVGAADLIVLLTLVVREVSEELRDSSPDGGRSCAC
jgi:hypothetical protein